MPIVPVGDFSRMRLTPDQWSDAWSIVGPSAEMNMRRDRHGRCLELWQVIASAYLEGLQHGAEIQREKERKYDPVLGPGWTVDPVC